MEVIGTIESLWRYPVKSMCGEQLQQAFCGFSGIYGDRLCAFTSSTAPKGFPFLTGREKHSMLQYRPRYKDPEPLRQPYNLTEAEALAPGVTPMYPAIDDIEIEVETPSGAILSVDDPELISMLREGLGEKHELKLARSHRSMTDCRPVSLFSIQTVRKLSEELKIDLDKRRFRANVYMTLESGKGFGEDDMVGRTLQIGPKALVTVPATSEPNPEIMRHLAREHDTRAGVYGAVLVEGTIKPGDKIVMLEGSSYQA
jgi:hypothetical protein